LVSRAGGGLGSTRTTHTGMRLSPNPAAHGGHAPCVSKIQIPRWRTALLDSTLRPCADIDLRAVWTNRFCCTFPAVFAVTFALVRMQSPQRHYPILLKKAASCWTSGLKDDPRPDAASEELACAAQGRLGLRLRAHLRCGAKIQDWGVGTGAESPLGFFGHLRW